MRGNILSLTLLLVVGLTGQAGRSAASDVIPEDAPKNRDRSALTETDTYLDLNTGKSFKIIYDGLNDIFNRADLFELELYVNTRTQDSFWLDQAVPVNNALIRDSKGLFRVDPRKVKRDGAGYKVVNVTPVVKKAEVAEIKVEKAEPPVKDSVTSM